MELTIYIVQNPEQGMMGESDDDDDAVGGDLETSLDIKQDSTDEENKALQGKLLVVI